MPNGNAFHKARHGLKMASVSGYRGIAMTDKKYVEIDAETLCLLKNLKDETGVAPTALFRQAKGIPQGLSVWLRADRRHLD